MSDAAQTVIIIGATSAIGRALAMEFAGAGSRVILAARDQAELETIRGDLAIRFPFEITAIELDVSNFESHQQFVERCKEIAADGAIGVIYVAGFMADQREAESRWPLARQMIEVNYAAAVSILNRLAAILAERKTGFICGISSVAGDRGRQSNYIYGSTKAALTTYLQGLRHHLFKSGVTVTTIKLGFVDTAMTWGVVKQSSPLLAFPEKVAKIIVKNIRRGKGDCYVPGIWGMIMLIIRSVPGFVFHRTRL